MTSKGTGDSQTSNFDESLEKYSDSEESFSSQDPNCSQLEQADSSDLSSASGGGIFNAFSKSGKAAEEMRLAGRWEKESHSVRIDAADATIKDTRCQVDGYRDMWTQPTRESEYFPKIKAQKLAKQRKAALGIAAGAIGAGGLGTGLAAALGAFEKEDENASE